MRGRHAWEVGRGCMGGHHRMLDLADADAFFYRRRAPTARPRRVPEPATNHAGTSHPSSWDLRRVARRRW